MMESRRKTEEILWVTGLHGIARSLYRATTGRTRTALFHSMQAFYRERISPGALVFDIGANVGLFSEVFASLGSRVVALEPNADCVRHIQISYPNTGIEVLQVAVGSQNGLAVLNVSDKRDDISSLSKDWIRAVEQQHAEYSGLWSKQLTVPVVTVDTLIERYGAPDFIKIDVEGFEEFVLDGLSVQPPLLSFEFNAAYSDAAMRCLNKNLFVGSSVFNFTLGDPVRFELNRWVSAVELIAAISTFEERDMHGDIFVRRPG
jgi:FkbM family methyltransferase